MYEKVFILNKTILNILSNFILHETSTVDDKDPFIYQKKKKKKKKTKSHLREKTMFIKAIEIVKTATTHFT